MTESRSWLPGEGKKKEGGRNKGTRAWGLGDGGFVRFLGCGIDLTGEYKGQTLPNCVL